MKTIFLALALAPLAWADCSAPIFQPVSISTSSPQVITITPANPSVNVHICTASIPLNNVVTLQFVAIGSQGNTNIGQQFVHAGIPTTNFNGAIYTGLSKAVGLSISAAKGNDSATSAGGGYITYYTTNTSN